MKKLYKTALGLPVLAKLVPDAEGHAAHDDAHLDRQGTRARASDSGGLVGRSRSKTAEDADGAHEPGVAVHVVHASAYRQGVLQGRLLRDERMGREPRRDKLRTHRSRHADPRLDAAHTGCDAQRARGHTATRGSLLGAMP